MSRSLVEVPTPETVVGTCVDDPDHWMRAIDDEAKVVCRDCLRRWLCVREACEMPNPRCAGGESPRSLLAALFALFESRLVSFCLSLVMWLSR